MPRGLHGRRLTARYAICGTLAFAFALLAAPRADAFIYWANCGGFSCGQGIGRANLDGSSAKTNFISGGITGPSGVAVDGTYVYWADTNANTIGRANLDGSGTPNDSFITGADHASSVAVDSAHIYWANCGGNNCHGTGATIGRANLDGNPASVNQNFITGANGPCGVAVDGAHIYWSNWGVTGSGATIGRANLDGNPASVNENFITGASGPCGVAVDSGHVYWANCGGSGCGSGTTIGRADLNGTPASVNQSFITGAGGPCGLAVDGSHIYWAGANTGTVNSRNLDGSGANNTLVTGLSTPCGVAVDSQQNPLPPPGRLGYGFTYPLGAPSSSFHVFHGEVTLPDGHRGLGVDTQGACRLGLSEISRNAKVATVAKAKHKHKHKPPLGLIKSVKLDVADPGYHVIPLDLTKKGLKLQKKKHKGALLAAFPNIPKADPIRITCTPLQYAGAPGSNGGLPTTVNFIASPPPNPNPIQLGGYKNFGPVGNDPPPIGGKGSAGGGTVAGKGGSGTKTKVPPPPPPKAGINATFSESVSVAPNPVALSGGTASVTFHVTNGSTITSLSASAPGNCTTNFSGSPPSTTGTSLSYTLSGRTIPVAPNGSFSLFIPAAGQGSTSVLINGAVTATGGGVNVNLGSLSGPSAGNSTQCGAGAGFSLLKVS